MPVWLSQKEDEFLIEDLCLLLCHALWNSIYPAMYALLNGAQLNYGETRASHLTRNALTGAEQRPR